MSSSSLAGFLKEQSGNDQVRFIAIDGHGGSGKSTLAELLSRKLSAYIIHTDDFASFDNPLNWWPLVIEHVFKPIQDGAKSLNYPRSKWWDEHQPEPVVAQKVTKIMILEGVSALRKEFRSYIDFGIYVDTPRKTCIQRGFERDKGMDGKSDEEILAQWNKWADNEDIYIARDLPEQYANVVIDGTKPLVEQLNI